MGSSKLACLVYSADKAQSPHIVLKFNYKNEVFRSKLNHFQDQF